MPLELAFVAEEDFATFVPPLFRAMGGYSQFVNALYPDNLTAEGQEKAIQRFIMQKKMDPSVQWLKVTDTDLGEIIGVAQWSVYRNEKPSEADIDGPPGTWPDDEAKEYCQAVYRAFMQDRRKVFRENDLPIMCLNIMGVFPKHQYRGAGTMMTKWGTDLADKIHALCVLEGTTGARWLYENAGFVVRRHFAVEAGGKFSNRPVDRLFFMVRPRPTKQT